jgi:hypothetical protein
MPEAYRREVDGVAARPDDPCMDDEPRGMGPGGRGSRRDPGELDTREAARIRRRDRDAEAAARDLMRPGMGKVFKQILDKQASAAKAPPTKRRRKKRA